MAAQKFTFETDVEPLRWFMLPNEAHNLLIGNSQNVRHKIPFDPNSYKGCKGDPLEVNACLGGGNKVKNYSLIYKSVEGKEVSSVPKEVTTENKILSSVSQENPSYIERKMASLYHYDSSERQNSFSSEISNPDYSEPICHHTACYSTSPQHAASSHSPAMNPLDVFCFSPQPSLPSPSANNLNTYPSQFHNYQNNCLPSKNYLNQYGNSGNLENLLHVDQACRGVKRFTNFNVTDRAQYNGKLDPQHPVNKVHFLLGRNETSRQRCNSLGSSLVLHPRNRNNLGCSCRSLTDGETSLNLSECSFSSNEDIHAYVTEVTKELATEIKSEIREVISKVEDVLSESIDAEGSINNLSEPRASICFEPKCEKLERTNSLPSASANDIAQYLMGVSKEMAEEMKSEIRGLVSSVVSTDSSPTLNNKEKKVTIEPQSKDRKDKHKKNEVSTVNNENISQSRDSGINLSYTETIVDSKVEKKKKLFQGKVDAEKNEESAVSKRNRSESLDSFPEDERTPGCRSESLDSLQENEDSDAAAKNQVSRRKISRASKKAEKCLLKNRLSGESSNDEGTNTEENVKSRWCCPSKAVWKPTVEVCIKRN